MLQRQDTLITKLMECYRGKTLSQKSGSRFSSIPVQSHLGLVHIVGVASRYQSLVGVLHCHLVSCPRRPSIPPHPSISHHPSIPPHRPSIPPYHISIPPYHLSIPPHRYITVVLRQTLQQSRPPDLPPVHPFQSNCSPHPPHVYKIHSTCLLL